MSKIIEIWEEIGRKNTNKIDDELLNQIVLDLLTTMKNQGLIDKIQDMLSPKFNRVKIDREDEIYFTAITTNLINEFVTDFGTSNFDDKTNERIMNILSESEKDSYLKLVNNQPNPSIEDLNNIFNDSLLEVDKSFKNYLSNFEDWKLKKKVALLNNCGYVDNEQNNKKIKELLISIENTDISIS